MDYEAVIGMEVHVQILTESKMFCGCSADYAAAPPNTHVCPVCLALPGVLPMINARAVESTVRTGLALDCAIPPSSKFDRKNYTYPDLPKGYQISQYDLPFCVDGCLEIEANGQPKRIGIRRVHLEEDTAKLMHQGDSSLVDFNRAGVPLMEIVTEADIRSGDEAWQYLTKLHTILRYLGVSTGNMEDGAMRCEANVSVRPVGSTEFGTKVEVKNLNSFRAVRQAIAYEIERHVAVIESGGRVEQVTMGWDENARRTVFQRSKEFAADYRYFPEPDLPPIELSPERVQALRLSLPELPDAKLRRLVDTLELKPDDAVLLVQDAAVAAFFEQTVASASAAVSPQTVANWMLGDLFGQLREQGSDLGSCGLQPSALAQLLRMVAEGAINATVAKQVLGTMMTTGDTPEAIVEREGLAQVSDQAALTDVVSRVLDAHPEALQQYLAGELKVLGFLIGQVMQATKGQANVPIVRELLAAALQARRS
jgi:aspartyl-tRNA(Asn)/glutamyl-tRNA(Gln) amidotransferase subunit B